MQMSAQDSSQQYCKFHRLDCCVSFRISYCAVPDVAKVARSKTIDQKDAIASFITIVIKFVPCVESDSDAPHVSHLKYVGSSTARGKRQ